LAIAQLAKQSQSPLLVLTPDIASQDRLIAEYEFFSNAEAPAFFPDWETLPYDLSSPHSEIISQRLQALNQLQADTPPEILVVAAPTALLRLCPKDYLQERSVTLEVGMRTEIEQLRQTLAVAGYQACSPVMAPGEYAVRGSVVDVFPMGALNPCRLDFLDDELESIRPFDAEHQISEGRLDSVTILPGREFPLTEDAIERFRDNFRHAFEQNPADSLVYRNISDAIVPTGIEYYLPLFFNETATLFGYLPQDTLILCLHGVEQALQQTREDAEERRSARRADLERPPLPIETLYLSEEEWNHSLGRFSRMNFGSLEIEEQASRECFNYPTRALPELRIRPENEEPARSLRHYLTETECRILFTVQSLGRLEQLQERLAGLSIKVRKLDSWDAFCDSDTTLALAVADLEDGFELHEAKLAVIPEGRLFPFRPPQQHRRSRSSKSLKALLSELSNLHIHSPVVHEDDGVGRYRGLEKLDIDGILHEFLCIQYAGTDSLYVPITELHRISRYSGADPENAPLHSLSGDQWKRIKRKAAQRAYDIAAELLDVQARRAVQSGCSLPLPQDYSNFEADFAFEETPDQAQAIQEVLEDLYSDTPMDRIICGDVGFGKTEVGMRAAFVAAFAGHQVAILTPTTLLAQQHGKTFQDRFAGWPLKIESISRFKSRREQAAVLERLSSGELDIIIGTHRLLQDDVCFHNLGLLIIDEEQRFGVRHKEKLKTMRAQTNLLTLTATPIPRTLNMSLSGLRDLSIIATAPAHRHAIKTYVVQWDDRQLTDACMRELKRGGQIYVLHNRVETIERMANTMRRLVPQAEVRVAHGQMRERELEAVMRDFYQQRFSILVCTTIIENGLDIPTANTIIIDQAERLGLPQLHQLRGRVGRSHHLAYAYLICPPLPTLPDDAQRRIQAIESMEELGSGFMLATQDLEIRGAGELLGEEQSGQIHQVGFALYHRLLQRAVETLKRGELPELDQPLEHGPQITLGLPALIPDDYLPDIYLRLMLYKRIASATSNEQLDELHVEMVDRFGSLPEPVRNLLSITRVKLEVADAGLLRKVEFTEQGGRLSFNNPGPEPDRVMQLIQRDPEVFRLDTRMRLHFSREMPELDDRITAIREITQELAA